MSDRIAIESAGIGDWHVGEPPDRRAITHAAKRGYDIRKQRARQISAADFERFNWILAMDQRGIAGTSTTWSRCRMLRNRLFLDFAPSLGVRDVPDPYYGAADGFERVLDLVESASDSLIEKIRDGARDHRRCARTTRGPRRARESRPSSAPNA